MAIQLYFLKAIETTLSAALPGKIVLIVLQLENLLDMPVLYSPSIIANILTFIITPVLAPPTIPKPRRPFVKSFGK